MRHSIVKTVQRKRPIIGEYQKVRIPDQFRECVTFLYLEKSEGTIKVGLKQPVATAFFIGVPFEQLTFKYVVTARHVIDNTRTEGKLYIRVKKTDGSYDDLLADHDSWISHPSSDVTVSPVALTNFHEPRLIRVDDIATDAAISQRDIGPGDDVFFVGLFREFPGYDRPEPTIRFGKIALMPREPIRLQSSPGTEMMMPAYLVEAWSFGGHSGSPVFVYFPLDRQPGIITGVPPLYPMLLGLIHGHYNLPDEVLKGDIVDEAVRSRLHSAITVVVPGQAILDLLHEDELVKQREKTLEEYKKPQPTPTPDIDLEKSSFTKETFIETLKKVSRLKPDKEGSGT